MPAKKKRGYVYLLSATVVVLLVISWLVLIRKDNRLDDWIFSFAGFETRAGRTAFMRAITFLGNYQFLTPANLLLVLFLFYKKENKLAITSLVVAVFGLLIKLGAKAVFHRPRPSEPLITGITNFSFPSGHAMMSIAFYGLLIWLLGQKLKNKLLLRIITIFLGILIFLIGYSRIYLRVHYASDVLAGYCIGILWLWFCLRFMDRYWKGWKKR